VAPTDLGRGLFAAVLVARVANGYQLATEAGPGTLTVIAANVDLHITAPDTVTAGGSRTYTIRARGAASGPCE
jgi:hypothetical protein